MQLDEEALTDLVLGILATAASGTIVTVRPNGAVETATRGTTTPADERRGRHVAIFVASKGLLSRPRVAERIRQGQARLEGL